MWIKIHKVGSGLRSITPTEAIDVALCWGWIDGIRKGFDERSYLQRYTTRRRKSVWSKVNVDNVARLIKQGRIIEHGLRHIEAAKADGRWERAYRASDMEIPADLPAAIEAEPRARAMLDKLTAQNRFALAFRVQNMKTEAGRRREIATLVALLKRGETTTAGKSGKAYASTSDLRWPIGERGNAPILSGKFSGVEVQYLSTERELGVILEVFSGMPGGRHRAA